MKKNILIISFVVTSCLICYYFYNNINSQMNNLYNRNMKEYYDIVLMANKHAVKKDESDIKILKDYMKQLKLLGKTTLIDLDTSFEEIPEYIYRKLRYLESESNQRIYILACKEIEYILNFFNNQIISVDSNSNIIINKKFNRVYLKNIRNDVIENYDSLDCVNGKSSFAQ